MCEYDFIAVRFIGNVYIVTLHVRKKLQDDTRKTTTVTAFLIFCEKNQKDFRQAKSRISSGFCIFHVKTKAGIYIIQIGPKCHHVKFQKDIFKIDHVRAFPI